MLQERKNMFFFCVTVGVVLLASRYHDNVIQNVKQFFQNFTKIKKKKINSNEIDEKNCSDKKLKISLDKVILADSPEKCDYAVQCICSNLSGGLLGFDCEWVNEGPVSLLQLATNNGTCALFRLQKIGFIPPKLKQLLASQKFLKVGVDPYEDGKKLFANYFCQVVGTLDLRTLANQLSLPAPKSLFTLCEQYLGLEMEKVLEVRCSDWNADTLTDEQIAYASYDALVSILIYHKILQQAEEKRSFWENLKLLLKSFCSCTYNERYFKLPDGVIDKKFKSQTEIANQTTSNNFQKLNQIIDRNKETTYKCSVPARKKPLYHNCYLQAPDGEILCTCDKKKADWYISKQLGEVVQDDPFTVRLKFEPSGRASGEVGKYYTQVKLNQCVVCGASEKFIRKNVVPREYRKYFPLVMKSHQSHDVLLLCPRCHEISNYHDLQLRTKLAELCNAPLAGPLSHVKDNESPKGWRKLQSAVKALKEGVNIPVKRKAELEEYIKNLTGCNEINHALLNLLQEQLLIKPPCKNFILKNQIKNNNINGLKNAQGKYQPHGLKVVQYYEKQGGGLVELEKLWREHFLNTMNPCYLPELWSVCHNQERLNIRLNQNRMLPMEAKIAGIRS